MFKVGEFARLAQTSVKTLHHYDEIGLLRPAHVEEATGYRFYAPTQLPRLIRIFNLRDLGFSLEQIAALLDAGLTSDQMAGLLRAKRAELEERVRAEQARLEAVTRRLERVERDGATAAPYEPQIKAVEALPVAALRCDVPGAEPEQIGRAIHQGFARLARALMNRRARFADPPRVVYWEGAESPESPGNPLVAIPVSGPLPPSPSGADDGVVPFLLPGEPVVASVVHHGPLRDLQAAYVALFQFLGENGWQVCGPHRDLMWQYGGSPDSPDSVDEIQFPVRRAAVKA